MAGACSLPYQVFFESSPDLYLLLTPSLTIVAATDAYLRASMTKREEIVGCNLFDVFSDNSGDVTASGVPDLRDSLCRVLKSRAEDTMAVRRYNLCQSAAARPTFEARYWSAVNTPILDEAGEVQFIIHRVEDLTESRRLNVPATGQDRLARQFPAQTGDDEGARATLEASAPPDQPVILVVEDNADTCEFIADVLRPEFHVITAEDGVEGLEQALYCTPDLIMTDLMMPRMNGDQLVREIRRRPELDEVPIMLLTARADEDLRVAVLREGAQDFVTKPFSQEELKARVRNFVTLKQARESLRLSNTALEERVAQRTAELSRSHEALRRFAWSASHDLHEPLRMVITLSQFLAESSAPKLDDEERSVLAAIEANGRCGETRLSGLRRYLQVVEAVDHAPDRVDCNDLVQAVLEQLSDSIDQSEAQITCADLPVVLVPPVLLKSIFENLIANAIMFRRHPRPRIHISAEKVPDSWVIAVRDDGVGIAPDQAQFIFGFFRRLRPHSGAGAGMGLAICREAVERLGGRIWVESQVGSGSTFRFTLPREDERRG